MDRQTLIYLAVATVILMLLVVVFAAASGGLGDETIALANAESSNFTRAKSQFNSERREVEKALASDPELFKSQSLDTLWPKRLEAAGAKLSEVEKDLNTVKSLVKEDDEEKEGEIEQALQRVRTARTFALAESSEMVAAARQRVKFKRDLKNTLQQLEADYKAIEATDVSEIQAVVQKAVTDWPGKKADLERRLEGVSQMIASSKETWGKVQEIAGQADAADSSKIDIDYDKLITAARVLQRNRANVKSSIKEIKSLTEQLYKSWEKILADMEIREGMDVTFHHKFKIMTTKIVDVENRENQTTPEEMWMQVPKSTYQAMQKNLGMTVEYKPTGKYDHEAVKTVQPAGFSYIAPPDQRRNQYGHWESRSGGGSFWVFYGQYALLRNLTWGRGGYRPINSTRYVEYDSARLAGRTYYGTDASGKPRYGSDGSVTRSRYTDSRYVRSDGYKNTRYAKSGGTYKGSRFETRTRRTPPSGRGFTRSPSRSRFGGK